MNTNIKATRQEVEKSLEFAKRIHKQKDQTNTDFGNKGINRRDEIDFIADTAEGKLAEILFSKFLNENWGIEFQSDFQIYPGQLTIDYGQDMDLYTKNGRVKRNIKRIDIKATKSYSKWLLVESHKFWADAYVLVKVDLPRDTEQNLNNFLNYEITGEIAGYAFHFDIIDPKTKEPWFSFSRQDKLFNPEILNGCCLDSVTPASMREYLTNKRKSNSLKDLNAQLKAERNFGIPVIWLRKNKVSWDGFEEWINSDRIAIENQIAINKLSKKP